MTDIEVIRVMFARARITHREQAEFYPNTLQPSGKTIVWIPGASMTFSTGGALLFIVKDYSESE